MECVWLPAWMTTCMSDSVCALDAYSDCVFVSAAAPTEDACIVSVCLSVSVQVFVHTYVKDS